MQLLPVIVGGSLAAAAAIAFALLLRRDLVTIGYTRAPMAGRALLFAGWSAIPIGFLVAVAGWPALGISLEVIGASVLIGVPTMAARSRSTTQQGLLDAYRSVEREWDAQLLDRTGATDLDVALGDLDRWRTEATAELIDLVRWYYASRQDGTLDFSNPDHARAYRRLLALMVREWPSVAITVGEADGRDAREILDATDAGRRPQ